MKIYALIISLDHNYFSGGYCLFQWRYDIDTADKYLIMMKILLALLLAFLLMLASLQADAEVLATMEPRVANRHLLSEPSSLGRKGNAGANDVKTPTSKKGNGNTETETGKDASGDDDETNESLGSYGGGSSTETHHHYTNGTRPPP
ncbi:late secretory pathway protein [Salix suchowensis]|nr:late secretory pathway protein [Salix suchowensis]